MDVLVYLQEKERLKKLQELEVRRSDRITARMRDRMDQVWQQI